MPEPIEKLARIETNVSTINKLIIATMSKLTYLPKSVEDFINNPDEEHVASVENTLIDCSRGLDGIRGYLSQVASEIFGVEPEKDENGYIEIQAMQDDEGVRLK